MPHLILSNPTTNSCDYEIYLSNSFNQTYYKQVRITSTNHGAETSNVPAYVVSKTAPISGTSKYVRGIIDNGMSPGRTYTLYAYAQAQNGTWYLAGSDTITTLNAQTSKTLNMPKNYNQFYTGNPDDFTRDCYCCSCCNVASFYRGYPYYTLSDSINDNAYANDGFYPGRIQYAAFTKYTTATTIVDRCTKMREEIDAERPIIVHYGGTAGHYATAFKYVNGGAGYADFYVLDSANWRDTGSSEGLVLTIPGAQSNNNVGSIDFLVTTTK